MKLPRVIEVDKDKCINCHQCIAVCTTKFANNGAGDTVEINDDLCIGCGECIAACTHEARIIIDDFDAAFEALKKKEKVVAIVAPAISSNFPGKFLNFNGWLKSLGVAAIFDVSFGAELTINSYLNHIQKNNPKTVIAQPCPALVSYIEIYRPELLPYLAPADSPMMHTVKMIKRYYPKYKNHKVLVVSPCIAKKREFDEVGLADFNVTLTRLEKYISDNKIDINSFPETDFDNDPAERAVLFSTPGGLLSTAERENKNIRNHTRKIEGPRTIYHYLDRLIKQINKGTAPVLIDCLNCEKGCNGGTGTSKKDISEDELEYYVRERKLKLQERYKTLDEDTGAIKNLRDTISKYWEDGLYSRSYINRHELYSNRIEIPTEDQLNEIYKIMHKYQEKDFLNCSSCGYNSCEMMAIAIHNKLNKPENCHFYLKYENDIKSGELYETNNKLDEQKRELIEQSENLLAFLARIRKYAQ